MAGLSGCGMGRLQRSKLYQTTAIHTLDHYTSLPRVQGADCSLVSRHLPQLKRPICEVWLPEGMETYPDLSKITPMLTSCSITIRVWVPLPPLRKPLKTLTVSNASPAVLLPTSSETTNATPKQLHVRSSIISAAAIANS